MRVLVRADASSTLGTGHVVRCLTLGRELERRGADVMFACRRARGDLLGWLTDQGVAAQPLEDDADDANATREAARVRWGRRALVDWLIVDHYELDERWERAVAPTARRTLVIDDLADRPHACDALSDPGLFPDQAQRYAGRLPKNARRLLGPAFALLRPAFAQARADARVRAGSIEHVLVSFGGSDPRALTVRAVQALRSLNRVAMVDVVVGASHVDPPAVTAACAGDSRFRVHRAVSDMAKLMTTADFFVGAGGMTAWERCCVGLPGIVFPVAANQAGSIDGLVAIGAAALAPQGIDTSAACLCDALTAFAADPAAVRAMSKRAFGVVDGLGAVRVADALAEAAKEAA